MLIDNNPPPVSADTHDHAGRPASHNDAARVHTPIASTASANDDPPATAGSSAPSSARAHRQKCAATSSARERNRASESLTVSAGRSISSATRRYPAPDAASSTAAPITSTASQRRSKHTSGNNTCVAPHTASRQRPRRGRSHRTPSKVRNGRRRAHPQPPRTPRPHRGHVSRPAAISASKPARSSATMSKINPSFRGIKGPLATPAKERRGGPTTT